MDGFLNTVLKYNKMIQKIKIWLSKSGLSNFGYAAGFFGTLMAGWSMAAGACVGIFLYINWNVIRKLIFKE